MIQICVDDFWLHSIFFKVDLKNCHCTYEYVCFQSNCSNKTYLYIFISISIRLHLIFNVWIGSLKYTMEIYFVLLSVLHSRNCMFIYFICVLNSFFFVFIISLCTRANENKKQLYDYVLNYMQYRTTLTSIISMRRKEKNKLFVIIATMNTSCFCKC